MKLTDTQLVLLSAASQREDRGIELAPNLKGGTAQKLVRKLLAEGLIEEAAACGSLPAWRRDAENRPVALRITTRGLAAIQVDEGGAQPAAEEPRETEQGADLAPGKPSRRAAARRNKGVQKSFTRPAKRDRADSKQARELRTLWRTTLRSSPPPALTKDLVARFICWHIQEQALGGLDPDTAKLLDGLARGDKPGADGPRRLKPGTVLVREYQGERHTVTVVPGGYVWREATYPSLSTIARAITGTAWSGPRFFGINRLEDIEGERARAHADVADAGRSRRRGGSVLPVSRKMHR